MKWLRLVLLLGAVTLILGCDEDKPASVCPDSPTIEPQAGNTNGSGGTNGLNTEIFHKLAADLREATTFALSSEVAAPKKGVVYPLSQAMKDKFLTASGVAGIEALEEVAARRSILEHAVQCALPEGVLLGDLERIYTGKGLLIKTHGWFNGPLTTPQAEDLFTCLAVLLNPAYKGVPVVLSGPSVDTRVESTPIVEALWTAELTEVGTFYHVWPILDAPAYCPDPDVAESEVWKYRVCGTAKEDCDLVLHAGGLWESDCAQVPWGEPPTSDDSHMECAVPDSPVARPAIRTTLAAPCDVMFLFCPPVPQ